MITFVSPSDRDFIETIPCCKHQEQSVDQPGQHEQTYGSTAGRDPRLSAGAHLLQDGQSLHGTPAQLLEYESGLGSNAFVFENATFGFWNPRYLHLLFYIKHTCICIKACAFA